MASPKERKFELVNFKRVRTSPNPFDDQGPDTLAGLVNMYMADPQSGGGVFQRPGTVRWSSVANGGNPGQGVYCHTGLNGTNYNFLFVNGKVWRQSTDMTSAPVDVSPIGITIATGRFVYVTSLNDSIIVNDGVNEPWVGSSLGSTPIVGTEISYDGVNAWSAYGQPVVYTGAVFFVLNTVNSVSVRNTIAWSEPNQPAVGYQQTDYDNAWTLTQTSADPIFALAATNDALYYSRQLSWGAITGAPNINFQNTATHDAVAANVGCVAPATVRTFLNYVYFADQNGRPYRFAIGGAPEPIWQQAQTTYDTGGFPAATPSMWAALEPNLNVYILGFTVSASTGAETLLVFDAMTGIYMGQWAWGAMDIAGILKDANGIPQLAAIGSNSAGTAYLWKLARLQDAVWTDNAGVMVISIPTGYLGYKTTANYTFTRAAMVVSNSSGMSVVPTVNMTFQTTQFSSGSAPNGYSPGIATTGNTVRLTWMTDKVMGRGAAMSFQPTTWEAQFRFYAIELDAVESTGGIDDR
jgi:hypothetical protein